MHEQLMCTLQLSVWLMSCRLSNISFIITGEPEWTEPRSNMLRLSRATHQLQTDRSSYVSQKTHQESIKTTRCSSEHTWSWSDRSSCWIPVQSSQSADRQVRSPAAGSRGIWSDFYSRQQVVLFSSQARQEPDRGPTETLTATVHVGYEWLRYSNRSMNGSLSLCSLESSGVTCESGAAGQRSQNNKYIRNIKILMTKHLCVKPACFHAPAGPALLRLTQHIGPERQDCACPLQQVHLPEGVSSCVVVRGAAVNISSCSTIRRGS